MKRWSCLPLLICMIIFNGCGPASKELESVISKKVAAEQAGQRARDLARAVEKARIAHDLKGAALLEQQREEATKQVSQLSRDVQDAENGIKGETEKQQVKQVAEEITNLQGELLASELEEDTAQDVERIMEEEDSPRELCRTTVRGLVKGAVCLCLKTYINNHRLPTDSELVTQLANNIHQACLPKSKTLALFKKAKALESLIDQIKQEPDNLRKLQRAAFGYGCILL